MLGHIPSIAESVLGGAFWAQAAVVIGDQPYDDNRVICFIRNWLCPRGKATYEQSVQNLLIFMDAAARGNAQRLAITFVREPDRHCKSLDGTARSEECVLPSVSFHYGEEYLPVHNEHGRFMTLNTYRNFYGNNLMRREVNGFSLLETVHHSDVRISKHSHERAHIAFVLKGVFREICEGKQLECRPLSVSFLAPGMIHSDDFRHGARSMLIELDAQRFDQVNEVLKMDEPLSHQGGPAAWLAIRLYNEALRTDSSPLAMEGIVLEILAELFREPLLSRIPPQWLYRVKDLLHSHFAEPLTHAEIATTVGVHPVHLATTFRRHFMCTIGEYVRRLRFEFACREILVDRFSLSAIATCSGFFDQSHFIRIFKQFAGCTPSRFRANLHYT